MQHTLHNCIQQSSTTDIRPPGIEQTTSLQHTISKLGPVKQVNFKYFKWQQQPKCYQTSRKVIKLIFVLFQLWNITYSNAVAFIIGNNIDILHYWPHYKYTYIQIYYTEIICYFIIVICNQIYLQLFPGHFVIQVRSELQALSDCQWWLGLLKYNKW